MLESALENEFDLCELGLRKAEVLRSCEVSILNYSNGFLIFGFYIIILKYILCKNIFGANVFAPGAPTVLI